MEKYGEAAMMSMVVERLPEIMAQIAKPMEQIDKILLLITVAVMAEVKLVKLLVMLLLMGLKF